MVHDMGLVPHINQVNIPTQKNKNMCLYYLEILVRLKVKFVRSKKFKFSLFCSSSSRLLLGILVMGRELRKCQPIERQAARFQKACKWHAPSSRGSSQPGGIGAQHSRCHFVHRSLAQRLVCHVVGFLCRPCNEYCDWEIIFSFFFTYFHQESGTFTFRGAVEDSATAEISRWQVWQWIFHRVNNLINSRIYRDAVEPDKAFKKKLGWMTLSLSHPLYHIGSAGGCNRSKGDSTTGFWHGRLVCHPAIGCNSEWGGRSSALNSCSNL